MFAASSAARAQPDGDVPVQHGMSARRHVRQDAEQGRLRLRVHARLHRLAVRVVRLLPVEPVPELRHLRRRLARVHVRGGLSRHDVRSRRRGVGFIGKYHCVRRRRLRPAAGDHSRRVARLRLHASLAEAAAGARQGRGSSKEEGVEEAQEEDEGTK